MMMEKYLLITGSSSGIGRQCAIQLSIKYNIILCARNVKNLEETKSMCLNPDLHIVFPLDLSDINDISNSLSSLLIERKIFIDKFLHCAGTLTLLPAKSFDYNIAKNIFDVNLFSAMEIIKTLLKKKPNQKALRNIIFISALYSKKGVIGNSFYASSKGALDSYMRCIAKELAPEINVNSILPGGLRTPMSEASFHDEENIEKIQREYPLGFGKTEDIANMVEFLFSDKAKWITGQQISVDGGASI